MSYVMSIGNESFNYTYNVSKMWYAACPVDGIRTFYGMTGREALGVQYGIIKYMMENKEHLMQFEPSNGYGSYEGALAFVCKLMQASAMNPNEIWEGD